MAMIHRESFDAGRFRGAADRTHVTLFGKHLLILTLCHAVLFQPSSRGRLHCSLRTTLSAMLNLTGMDFPYKPSGLLRRVGKSA
jgi:hypothetical protein